MEKTNQQILSLPLPSTPALFFLLFARLQSTRPPLGGGAPASICCVTRTSARHSQRCSVLSSDSTAIHLPSSLHLKFFFRLHNARELYIHSLHHILLCLCLCYWGKKHRYYTLDGAKGPIQRSGFEDHIEIMSPRNAAQNVEQIKHSCST